MTFQKANRGIPCTGLSGRESFLLSCSFFHCFQICI
nr:MAG TPA: hypothetical protein [Bacteriophage sp.]